MVRRKGLVCIFFRFLRKKIKVLPPSSRRQATVHRTVALNCSSPSLSDMQKVQKFSFHLHPYRMQLKAEGLSHGLKSVHRTLSVTVHECGTPEGTRLHFSFHKERKIMVLPPSSWRQATVHRTVALNCSSPFLSDMQKDQIPNGIWSFWYAGRDSNPQPSEPESDALSIEPPAHA